MQIIPSLLAAPPLRLETEIQALLPSELKMLHIDVMDNHYVPNLSFSPQICQAIHQTFPQLLLDVHLMVSPVDRLITAFAEAGAHRIAIHPDACLHLHRHLSLIREQDCLAG
ncbi:MAG: ribulose-phosphate 3-epimerase, partial [Legionellaceae bacterium]|nr:ribulose-phosphate 3-epimerase [Legionellaceae bacterium]